MEQKLSKETLCVQAGWTPKNGEPRVVPIYQSTTPRVVPIYQSTTFKYDDSDQMARLFDLKDTGYFYTRLQNPTNDAVASKIAALEGGVGAILTSSGQAANFYAVFNICEAGDHIVCSSTIYGGTGYRMYLHRCRCARRRNRQGFPAQYPLYVRRNHLESQHQRIGYRKICPHRP